MFIVYFRKKRGRIMSRILIPGFISEQFQKKQYKGKFPAGIISIDVEGFTKMTESLIRFGTEGSEIISDLINRIFEPMIETITKHGGWISSFEGDALVAVFPQEYLNNLVIASMILSREFGKVKFSTKRGKFNLKSRIGLSFGQVSWDIIETSIQSTFCFYGDAITDAIQAQHLSRTGKVIISKTLQRKFKEDISIEKFKGSYFILNSILNLKFKKVYQVQVGIPKKLQKIFVSDSVLSMRSQGEFRNVVSVFISVKQLSRFRTMIKPVLDLVNRYHGYLDKLFYGDKGYGFLVLFGAPTGLEHPVLNAVNFSERLRSNLAPRNQVKVGISYGKVYAGFIGSSLRSEYSVLGSDVNLASRLMTWGDWGDIIYTAAVQKEIKGITNDSLITGLKLKGFSSRLKVFQFKKLKITGTSEISGEIFGRETEIMSLMKSLSSIRNRQFGGLVYIDGLPGIGKSRLVEELKVQFQDEKFNWFTLQCNQIHNDSFHPIKYFLKRYFHLQSQSIKDLRKIFEKVLSKLEARVKDKEIKLELTRSKSVLGSILNIKGSVQYKMGYPDSCAILI